MSEVITVLIADDNYEFGNLLKTCINADLELKVIGLARDGLQALEKIKTEEPDVVVLDIIMPNLDGIGVLEKINEMQMVKKPMFIMLSAIGQDVFIQKAIILGAEYYIVKPFNGEILIKRIKELFNEKSPNFSNSVQAEEKIKTINENKNINSTDNSIEFKITSLLRDVGIPVHMAGYLFLREAIVQCVHNNKLFSSITKSLYPNVAEHFNTTSQKVERSIRNAIETAWSRGNPDSIDSLFGYSVSYSKGKPTNSEFIAMMSDKIRVDLGLEKRDIKINKELAR